MTPNEKIKSIQEILGVTQDGHFGPKSQAALAELIRLAIAPEPSPRPGAIKVCVDAGHGQDSRAPGVFDTGATGSGLREADITFEWSMDMAQALVDRGAEVFLTRNSQHASAPLSERARRAREQGCTHLLSIHVNDFDEPSAHGVETLYRDSQVFAMQIQEALVDGTGLRDRKVKYRPELAVLKFDGPAALIEIGFIKNSGDVAKFMDPQVRRETCRLIAQKIVNA